MTLTRNAQRFFERMYHVDMSRNESCEVALDSDQVMHVKVTKYALGTIAAIEVPIRLTGYPTKP